jgi:2-isopropylmalate synthase
VSAITGLTVQRNKAIVGQNAFAHEAGIHQHGMLKNPTTYEILRPEDVGFPSSQMVLGKHSGRHALRARLGELGFELEDGALDALFATFKTLADRKKEVFDSDLVALAGGGPHGGAPRPAAAGEWQLVTLQAHAGNAGIPAAVVVLRDPQGEERAEAACGDGPLDAAFRAIVRLVGIEGSLRDLEVRSVTRGEDAQAEAVVEVEHAGRLHRGRGLSTDIVEAAVRAALAAVNRILAGADGAASGETAAAVTGAAEAAVTAAPPLAAIAAAARPASPVPAGGAR